MSCESCADIRRHEQADEHMGRHEEPNRNFFQLQMHLKKHSRGSCEHKSWDLIKDWEFLDQLSDYQILTKAPNAWNYLVIIATKSPERIKLSCQKAGHCSHTYLWHYKTLENIIFCHTVHRMTFNLFFLVCGLTFPWAIPKLLSVSIYCLLKVNILMCRYKEAVGTYL